MHASLQAAALSAHSGHIALLFVPVAGVTALAVREWWTARRRRGD
jgi:hypothetical protein